MPMRVECAWARRGWMARSIRGGALLLCAGALMARTSVAQGSAAPPSRAAQKNRLPQCRRAVVDGIVHEGQGFQVEFARGLVFGLEPIRSGWALRVVAAGKPRGPHDYAEVATLPYQSVSPLLLSTDWAFRAQDAVGWTPRRFRYAGSASAYAALAAGYDGVVRGDMAASERAALIANEQPEGVLEIEDARLAPGAADQVRTAAAVSSRFTQTPHTLDGSGPPSMLGRLEEVRFRVLLDLPDSLQPARSVEVLKFACPVRPTVTSAVASHTSGKQNSD